jgi:predicted MFS family arabinose efflux permease
MKENPNTSGEEDLNPAEPAQEVPSSPIEKLTICGRLLLFVTLLLFCSGFYFSFLYVSDHLPSGSYPLFAVLMPTGTACLFFFLIAGWLLERAGVKIYNSRKKNK